jgi:hypothetical protein
MEEATGEIIGILPSVELYLPSALDIVAEVFTDHDVQWVVGQYIHIDGGDDEISMQRPMKPDSLASYLRRDSGFLPTSCTFIRKAVLDLFGGFDPTLRFAYDYEMWAELLTAGIEPVLLDEPIGSRRQTPTRYSSADAVQRGFEYIEVARRFAHHLPINERDALQASCDQRERIYTLANAEALGNRSRRYLLQQIMKHPAWMQDESVRRTLMHGTPALPLDDLERAA